MTTTKEKLESETKQFIANLIEVLQQDPLKETYLDKEDLENYKRDMTEYLNELIEKDDNIRFGIIVALEHHLEK